MLLFFFFFTVLLLYFCVIGSTMLLVYRYHVWANGSNIAVVFHLLTKPQLRNRTEVDPNRLDSRFPGKVRPKAFRLSMASPSFIAFGGNNWVMKDRTLLERLLFVLTHSEPPQVGAHMRAL